MRLVGRLQAFGDRLRGFAQPWELAAFVWLPGIGIGYACWYELRAHDALQDFGIFRTAALSVVHGRSPYVVPNAAAFAHFDKFVYPPVAALFFAPFAALPPGAARVVMFVAGLAAVLGALRLLGVEDWRCYGLAVVSAPAINALALGALTSFLLLGAALVWRYRDNPAVAGVATAFTAVLKLFLATLGWYYRVHVGLMQHWKSIMPDQILEVKYEELVADLETVSRRMIDFVGLRSYPTLIHVLEQVESPVSYSAIALLGLSGAAASAVTAVVSLTAVVAIWFTARGADGDRRALAVAVVASLVATPLLWLHYLLLLYVPVALYRPRLSGVWFVPLVLWLTPTTHSHGTTWRIALALGVLAVIAVRTVFDGPLLSRAGVAPRPAAS